jgi:hypothetical protein
MKRRFEFSKIIFTGVSMVTLSIVAFSCFMIYTTKDLQPLAYLIPAIFVEMATATGFYYNKARDENLIKIQKGGPYE